MLKNGLNMLDDILKVMKGYRNLKGVGFNFQSLKKQVRTSVTEFIPPKSKSEFAMLDQMSQHPIQHLKPQARSKLLPWKYHYYGRYGHIKSYYYILHA